MRGNELALCDVEELVEMFGADVVDAAPDGTIRVSVSGHEQIVRAS